MELLCLLRRVQKMAGNVHMENDLAVLGDEWAPREDTMRIIDRFIRPYIGHNATVAEIGSGGGNILGILQSS
jgi:hypothetical protein